MIDTKRMIWAFLAALAVAVLYEILVYRVLLNDFHAAHSDWLRPLEHFAGLRYFLTLALDTALITLFYALFARHRASSLSTGIVFGVLLGLIAGWAPQAFNKLYFQDYPFYLHWGPAIFGEFVLVGVVLGLVYRE